MLAGIVLGLVVCIFPLGYFIVSYQYSVGATESESEINAEIISQIISANPTMWQFEKVRIEEYLSRRPRKAHFETRRVLNQQNIVVAECMDELPAPVMARSAPLFDSGVAVGRLEVSRSLRPLLNRSMLLGLAMLPLGAGVFLVLKILPIRAIRKIVGDALRKERDTAQLYLDIAGVMLVAIDAGQRVTMINRKGCKILGYQEGEMLHSNWLDNFVPEKSRDNAKELFAQLAESRTEQYAVLESPVLTSDGSERLISWHHIVLTDAVGQFAGILSSGEDVTEQKSLEAQLLHAQKMDAIGQLAGGVAHDFSNIITVIIGYCSLMQMQTGEDDPQRFNINQILAASERASNLARSLLLFSRKDAITPERANMNDIVMNMGKFIKRIIGEDIQLETVLYKEPLDVYVDAGQIEQVLMNLSTNARDAMDKGGKLIIETSIQEITAAFMQVHGYGSPGLYSLITVSDSGRGMDEKTQARIYEPFFTTKEVGKGTGLGLSIVYGIVKQHKGFITVYSEQGKGTTFSVYLPLMNRENAGSDERQHLSIPSMGTETILVAEDDISVCTLVETVLGKFGYEVIIARDGQEAVEKFSANRERIHLVLMDIIMPRKNGREAYEEIRNLKPNIKFLFTSGYDMEIIRSRGQIGEDMELIMKPVRPLMLLAKIREILDFAS
jgi:PAS domain S-box-containing protein